MGAPPYGIIVAAILGIAVVGLLIWAVVTRSDLDDANATIESQQQNAEQAFGAIFDGPTLKAGVEKAASEPQNLMGNCGPTLKTPDAKDRVTCSAW